MFELSLLADVLFPSLAICGGWILLSTPTTCISFGKPVESLVLSITCWDLTVPSGL